jgi:hypothetical protein
MAKTFNEYFSELEEKIKEAVIEAELVAIIQIEADFLRRIFNRGEATDGTKIGNYSTKPMLTGAKNFKDSGKANNFFSSKPEFRTVKTNKGNKALGLVPGGYREFRQLNGLEAGYVNLQFTDKLFNSIQRQFVNGNWVLGFVDSERLLIARYNENHFKKIIFEPSEAEIKAANEAYNEHLRIKIQELFNSW